MGMRGKREAGNREITCYWIPDRVGDDGRGGVGDDTL